ncbi:leucine-rich repeat protein [Butyrivibrio sp. VCD2006]|uniref:leucine-rich repeat protein n=1 Tax=Butyrivibrio sp. VCD2006 TaxID=1280664 RepID=UPI0004281326|nr:leucine-rich repeat protein [Butyrivibrio sp. VCD2006]
MFIKKGSLRNRLQSVILAAAVAVAIIPTTLFVTNPITAEASTDSVADVLGSYSANEKQIFTALNYLDTRIFNSNTEVTGANKSEFDSASFYTMYTGATEKKKYTVEEVRFARRAYIYSNPLNIAGAMAQLKFLYIKKEGKYSCYAFLQRTSENDYSGETQKLKAAIKKIMKNIDDDTNFVKEMQCFDMVIDNTTYYNIAIDNKDLKNTAYGALVMHRASSQGYALAFEALLDEAEISNDILFNNNKCWNQVKIGTKWYESDLVACDKSNKGTIDYTRFNTSQKKMKNYGLTRVNYCTKLRESKGTYSTTKNKIQKYEDSMFKDSKNFSLGVLNPDNTVTRSTLLSSETVVNIVPVYLNNSQMYDCSVLLKSLTLSTKNNDSYFTWTQWTPQTPYITVTKGAGKGTNRTFNVTMVLDDGANNGNGTTISFSFTLNDNDDTRGNFKYKITGEDTVSLVKCTKKNIKNLTIPSAVVLNGKSYKITKIEKNAFSKCNKLETVMIGSYVNTIGANAFSGKAKLIRVETLGYNVSTFGKNAFKSADSNTMFLIKAASYNKFKKVVKKYKKAGGKNSVYKYRAY